MTDRRRPPQVPNKTLRELITAKPTDVYMIAREDVRLIAEELLERRRDVSGKEALSEVLLTISRSAERALDALGDAFRPKLKIAEDVLQERQRQDAKWGGPEHDDTHTEREWTAFIAEHLGRAGHAISADDSIGYRHQMVRVAALTFAALEAFDRKGGK